MNHNKNSWRGLGRSLLLCVALMLSASVFAGAKEEIQAAMRAGRWESADQQLQKVLAKHPDNALAHYWRAQTQLKLGHEDLAKAELQKASELDPAEKFAGDKALLAKLRKRLGLEPGTELTSAPSDEGRIQLQEPAPKVEPVAAAPAVEEPPTAPPSSGWGLGRILLILVLIGVPAVVFLIRKQGLALLKVRREEWRGRLREASGDLDNALRASDANQQLSPEAKLGNYDRVRQAKAEIDGALAALASTTKFDPVSRIIDRGQDLAADLRGEQRPSERRREQEAANLAYEREMRVREMEARAQQPAFGQGQAGGSSILPTVAAAAVGVALGSAMSHASARGRDDEDEMRRRDAEYDRLSSSSSSGGSDLDLGGGGDSSSDWSSGSSDTSGGGDQSFD